jgi:hypothetical protein
MIIGGARGEGGLIKIMDKNKILKQIDDLRSQWKMALPGDRKIIEARATLLKWSIRDKNEELITVNEVKNIFGISSNA